MVSNGPSLETIKWSLSTSNLNEGERHLEQQSHEYVFCRISHIISSLSREQTLRPRRERKEFILEAVLGNRGR